MKDLIKYFILPPAFGLGYLSFLVTKKTFPYSYVGFRFLFVKTNGRINNFHSKLISFFHKPSVSKGNTEGILGSLSQENVQNIVSQIQKDGFYEFDVGLNSDMIDSLNKFALTTPVKHIDTTQSGIHYSNESALFNPNKIASPRYQFDTSDIIKDPTVEKLIVDNTLREIASRYLNTKPILDAVTMWWSSPFGKKGTSQSAQMYHFDMDRFKFIKFFFYLTDVHTDNGPHCYIQSSHLRIPKKVRKDRRMSDEELKQYYSAERFKEFTGKKGTILAVDTRGLHKGKPLVSDNRLLLQIQFSNSLFGTTYQRTPIKVTSSEDREKMSTYKRTYQLFKSPTK